MTRPYCHGFPSLHPGAPILHPAASVDRRLLHPASPARSVAREGADSASTEYGETEAIALALEIGADIVLLDERNVRSIASRLEEELLKSAGE